MVRKGLKLIIISLILVFIYIYYQISMFKINHVRIEEAKLPKEKKIKIVQISDYHDNDLINKKKLLKDIEKLNPDIIVLTGDIIDHKTKNFDNTIFLLKNMKKINPKIYFVSGNHEKRNENGEEFIEEISRLGIINFDYKYELLNINGVNINLCGIPYYKGNNQNTEVFNDIDKSLFTILLSHSPQKALQYSGLNSDLTLAGHIHGGQVRFPIIGAIISPEGGFFPKYSKGLYELEDGKLYLDSGLGNSFKPIRLFNRIQISYIEIEGK
ncbi:metallophosphoesterase [Gottschalkia acidurici 9a]|uniref:Metallophosphoesterase n=1 Tax=Gottschalkia acidurici (strain ATCC 7906 / DSM 604 / BCRC 14475 / CIP 104303 / KCTC 5404 / NCIMB 10678 / 9a) TaxID=1128398 RepID=K0B2Q9_GOTA9|nr:metallophosphoesterase [Gottschalkia acidurici]AFS79397.1 metallophosphoesterase [Gottschalkia acidurici 9a]